jgi:hypothetical protein
MWQFRMISKGNTGHIPSIPDGALIDFGYSQRHSDGTEVVNSGGHSPASANWCMGVWSQTGFWTYQINHFPIAYNPTTGEIANYINFRAQITLSPGGDSYSGTFTLDVYDPMGNHVDHLAGNIVAKRITVDSTIPERSLAIHKIRRSERRARPVGRATPQNFAIPSRYDLFRQGVYSFTRSRRPTIHHRSSGKSRLRTVMEKGLV